MAFSAFARFKTAGYFSFFHLSRFPLFLESYDLPAYLLESLSPYFPQVDVFHTLHFTTPVPDFLAFFSKVIFQRKSSPVNGKNSLGDG